MMPEQKPDLQASARLQQILAMLRQEDAVSIAGSLGQLLMGLGILFVAGFVVATAMTIILDACVDKPWIGWSGWFLVYVLIMAPLLAWYERRSREDYLGNAAGAVDANPSSHGEYKVKQITVGVGVVAGLLVWGPRAVIDGTRGLRGQRSARQHSAFDRAALLVLDLERVHTGVEIKRLLHPPEDMESFGLAVDLLDKHGWIGRSTDGKSLWLNSTWREKLKKAMQ